MVKMSACHAGDRGSIPRSRAPSFCRLSWRAFPLLSATSSTALRNTDAQQADTPSRWLQRQRQRGIILEVSTGYRHGSREVCSSSPGSLFVCSLSFVQCRLTEASVPDSPLPLTESRSRSQRVTNPPFYLTLPKFRWTTARHRSTGPERNRRQTTAEAAWMGASIPV
jgi:hypothetical protein